MAYATSFTFGSLTITAENMDFNKVPGTVKQIVGGKILRLKEIPDKTEDWKGTIKGVFYDSNRNADRDTLQAIRDGNLKAILTDGLHNGEYYILNLRWEDNANTIATEQRFTMDIIQEQ